MERARNAESLPFGDAITKEGFRCKEALLYQYRFHSYIDRGCYLEQMRRLLCYFSRDNVLVLKYGYLKYHLVECLKDISGFLEIDYFNSIIPGGAFDALFIKNG